MNKLLLDGPAVHKTYYGRIIDLLPKLLAECREPMSVAHLMEQRIAIRQGYTPSSTSERQWYMDLLERGLILKENVPNVHHDDWWNNSFTVADLWLWHPDKGAKVVAYNAQVLDFLREHAMPENKLVDYKISLPDGLYEKIEGLELTPADFRHLGSHGYNTPEEAKQSTVWRELAGTQKRLNTYVDSVFAEKGKNSNLMTHYFGGPFNIPTAQLWNVGRKRDNSDAHCFDNLINEGYVVGVKPEAHVVNVRKKSWF